VDCDNLEGFLVQMGGGSRFKAGTESGKENMYSCVVLHGGRPQYERTENFQAFKQGDVRFLISTDVGARGLDVKELPFVVNMTLPDKSEMNIHRIGRVGRADRIGMAISIVADCKERVWWHNCNRKDKGRGCTNVKLTSEGGCTIWYDESQLLQDIEKRLGAPITRMDVKQPAQGFQQHLLGLVQRTAVDNSPEGKKSAEHMEYLRPAAEELAKLEVQAQTTFHSFQNSTDRWVYLLKGKGEKNFPSLTSPPAAKVETKTAKVDPKGAKVDPKGAKVAKVEGQVAKNSQVDGQGAKSSKAAGKKVNNK